MNCTAVSQNRGPNNAYRRLSSRYLALMQIRWFSPCVPAVSSLPTPALFSDASPPASALSFSFSPFRRAP